MSQFLHSVSRWFRQNGFALVRIMFSLICIGLVIYKAVKMDEVDLVSVILLILAALSFRPTMFEVIPRFVRRFKVAGVDVDLQIQDSGRIQEKLEAAQSKPVSPSEPVSPASAAGSVGEISEIVRTKKIVLYDSGGNEERARLFVGGDGTVNLQLCDPAGQLRAAMWVLQDGESGITLSDNRGVTRLWLRGTDTPVVIHDTEGFVRGGFLVDDDNVFHLALLSDDGHVNCWLYASEDGSGLRIGSTDQKSDAGLVAMDGVSGALYLSNHSNGRKTRMLAGHDAVIDRGKSSE